LKGWTHPPDWFMFGFKPYPQTSLINACRWQTL